MYKNYFKIAFRNLLKNKIHSLINIFGLAIGLATSLLILIYVFNEWSYDKFHEHSDRVYRVVQTASSEVKTEEQASTPFPLAPVLAAEFPDMVKKSVRFYDMQEASQTFLNREEEVSYREENFYFTDSTFFDVFSAELVRGNPDEVLKNPSSLVITENLAKKFFGDENPMGRSLNYRGVKDLTVTGVMKAWPDESHMDIDLLISFSTLAELYRRNSPDFDQSWHWNPLWTYVLLSEGVNPDDLEAQLPAIAENYYYASPGWPSDESIEFELQPVTDIHLHSNRDLEMQANGSITYVYILLVVAGFILIIACINFMNLSTARSVERSREVGIRKVLGSYRTQLFYQFIGESFIVSFIAIVIGVLLVLIFLPYFNGLVDKNLTFSLFQSYYIIPGLLLLTGIVGLISGSYPAVFLSSFKPADVLKGNTMKGKNSTLFRKGLVTFQFTLSVILIIGTAIIYQQLQYIQEKDLGFDQNAVLILPTKQNLIAWEFDTFTEQALSHAQVTSITGIGKIPGNEKQEYYRYVPARSGESEDGTSLALYVTHDFTETFDLDVIAGRSFSRDFSSDPQNSILINRKMLSQLEAEEPEEALGEEFYFYDSQGERETLTVVGVLEDFNYSSLKKEIDPLVIRLVVETMPILGTIEHTAVEIAPGNPSAAIAHLEEVWEEVNHIDPFEYTFLDEYLASVYKAETVMSTMATYFSILCIIIACLGLLGLASYSAQLKKQEIGIRKSLGATITNIVGLLSKEFLMLVGIANIIAWPLAYYFGGKWLQSFPYRFDLVTTLPLIFIVSGLLVVIIALATIGYHSVKAALINPVEAIRSE